MIKIKYYRNQKGLTQIELANAMGVAQSTVADWESGNSSPSSSKLPQLAIVLGCTIDGLFGTIKNEEQIKEEKQC